MKIPPLALRLGQGLLRITGAPAAVVLVLFAAMLVITAMPGRSHRGALPAATTGQQILAQQLRQHVTVLAAQEHNARHPVSLAKRLKNLDATAQSDAMFVL